MTDRKQPGVAFWATVAISCAVPIYFGMYFAMLKPDRMTYRLVPRHHWLVHSEPAYGWGRGGRFASNQDVWKAIFAPAHYCHRSVSPKNWDTWGDVPMRVVMHEEAASSGWHLPREPLPHEY